MTADNAARPASTVTPRRVAPSVIQLGQQNNAPYPWGAAQPYRVRSKRQVTTVDRGPLDVGTGNGTRNLTLMLTSETYTSIELTGLCICIVRSLVTHCSVRQKEKCFSAGNTLSVRRCSLSDGSVSNRCWWVMTIVRSMSLVISGPLQRYCHQLTLLPSQSLLSFTTVPQAINSDRCFIRVWLQRY